MYARTRVKFSRYVLNNSSLSVLLLKSAWVNSSVLGEGDAAVTAYDFFSFSARAREIYWQLYTTLEGKLSHKKTILISGSLSQALFT